MRHAQLRCTLKHGVLTDEGDYIPEATPVTVRGYSPDELQPVGANSCHVIMEVEVDAYIFIADEPPDDGRPYRSDVHTGLIVDVPASALIFKSVSPTRRKQ